MYTAGERFTSTTPVDNGAKQMRPRIMHYYVDPFSSGGPTTYINTIVNSELSNQYVFKCCYQYKALSALRFSDIKRIVAEIRDFDPDILHVHGLQAEGFVGVLAGKIAGCRKILVAVHGMENDSVLNSKMKRFIFRYLVENTTLGLADGAYCVCEATEKTPFFQKCCKNKLPYLWNCVGAINPYRKEMARAELGFTVEDYVIVIVGRVTAMKGFDEIIEMIAADSLSNRKYLIVGDGPKYQEMIENLQLQIAERKVIVVGQQRDVGKYYSAADAYLSASYKENLSISILEAGAFGLPCVVTDVGGNKEIIPNEQYGIVVSSHNSNALKQGLDRLCADRVASQAMGVRLAARIEQLFSQPVFIRRVNDMYQSILARKIK